MFLNVHFFFFIHTHPHIHTSTHITTKHFGNHIIALQYASHHLRGLHHEILMDWASANPRAGSWLRRNVPGMYQKSQQHKFHLFRGVVIKKMTHYQIERFISLSPLKQVNSRTHSFGSLVCLHLSHGSCRANIWLCATWAGGAFGWGRRRFKFDHLLSTAIML